MSADGSIAAARTTAATSQWFTPPLLVEPARRFLGGVIDLDPASCEVANRTVQARSIFTDEHEDTDGLASQWNGHVFCNPPSPPRPWWRKLRAEIEAGRVTRAVFVGYSIEVLQQFQDDREWLRRWHVCVPAKRVRYLTTAGDRMRTLKARLAKAVAEFEADNGRKIAEGVFERRAGLSVTVDVVPMPLALTRLHLDIDDLEAMAPDALVSGDAPAHASVVLGYGDAAAGRLEWRAAFGDVGVCW